ncbi:hypothetical protein ACYKEA_004870 [Pluralibacter gergoviae]
MSFTKSIEIKKGEQYPDLGLANAPDDAVVEVTYEVVAIELVTPTMASARYTASYNGAMASTNRIEFDYTSRDFIFTDAESVLSERLS